MASDSYIFQMARIILALFKMGTHKDKEDLFFKEDLFIKDKLGIMLLKGKELWLMMYNNINMSEIGSMICLMAKANKFGETVLTTKVSF
jgi:hypothetical protein